jgi:hypothetical protein
MKLGVKEMKKAYKEVKIDQIEVSCRSAGFCKMCTCCKDENKRMCDKLTEKG